MTKKPVITFSILILIVLYFYQEKQIQNPPAQIDTERQAKIKKALKELKSENSNKQKDAVRTLGELGAKEYIKDIARLLKSGDIVQNGWDIVYVWTPIDDGFAQVPNYNDKNKDLLISVMVVLGNFSAKEYAKDIAELLNNVDRDVQVEAIKALGKLDAKEYTEEITNLLFGKWVKDISYEVFYYQRDDVRDAAKRVIKEWGVDVEKLKSKNQDAK